MTESRSTSRRAGALCVPPVASLTTCTGGKSFTGMLGLLALFGVVAVLLVPVFWPL